MLSNSSNYKIISENDFELIFKKYYHQLYSYAYNFVMEEMLAEDIVQDAFFKLWEIRKKMNSYHNIRAYLYMIVKNLCLKYFKRQQLTDKYLEKQSESHTLSYFDDFDFEEVNELEIKINKAKKRLSAGQLKIIDLYIKEEKSYKEISEILDISVNTVKTQLRRAYQKLRDDLSSLSINIILFLKKL